MEGFFASVQPYLVPVGFIALMVLMHAIPGGHGSHGGHGSDGHAAGQGRDARPRSDGCGSAPPNEGTEASGVTGDAETTEREKPAAGGHQHG